MTIKSVNAPAIGEKGITRLLFLTAPAQMTPEGGAFQAGYEQAKRDLRERIIGEVGRPQDDIMTAEQAVKHNAAQQPPETAKAPLWRRWWPL